MEVYISPPEGSRRVLTREQVIAALASQGIQVLTAEDEPGSADRRARWILTFVGTEIRLEFQEAGGALVFATLDQPMLDASNLPDRICEALESTGWEVDQENLG